MEIKDKIKNIKLSRFEPIERNFIEKVGFVEDLFITCGIKDYKNHIFIIKDRKILMYADTLTLFMMCSPYLYIIEDASNYQFKYGFELKKLFKKYIEKSVIEYIDSVKNKNKFILDKNFDTNNYKFAYYKNMDNLTSLIINSTFEEDIEFYEWKLSVKKSIKSFFIKK